MRAHGRLFTIDFLLAIGIVMLSVGSLLNTQQTTAARLHEQVLWTELEAVGQTAAVLLVTNPANTCAVTDSANSVLYHLNDCVNLQNSPTAQTLGIPNGFAFRITMYNPNGSIDNSFSVNGAATPGGNAVFSTDLNVFTSNGNLSKAILDNCLRTGAENPPSNTLFCNSRSKVMRMTVWRA
jgi:hypothetical protein